MKKNRIIYIFVALLIAVASIYFFSNSKGTLKLRNTSFAIENMDKVTGVKISAGNEILWLEKEMDSWKVNGKYKVKQANIENFLNAIHRIDLLSPVSKAEKDQIRSILKSDGVLVAILKNNRTLRKYYISKPEMSKSKTYMMMYKSTEPYLVHIPSSKEQVANWFVLKENFWRDKTVFDLQPQNIKTVSILYPQNSLKSFKVINYNNGSFALQDINQNMFVDDFNVEKVARYFTYFQKITFENMAGNLSQDQVDSVLQSTPYLSMQVEDVNGIINTLTVYRKPSENDLDEFGQKVLFDYTRAYATLNKAHELILIQYYLFDPLFKEIDYFR